MNKTTINSKGKAQTNNKLGKGESFYVLTLWLDRGEDFYIVLCLFLYVKLLETWEKVRETLEIWCNMWV